MSSKHEPKPQSVPAKLNAWNDLLEEIKLPNELAVPFMFGRPELVKALFKPRQLSLEESVEVVNALRVLMETNIELQKHSQELAKIIDDARGAAWHAWIQMNRGKEFASFRQPFTAEELKEVMDMEGATA